MARHPTSCTARGAYAALRSQAGSFESTQIAAKLMASNQPTDEPDQTGEAAPGFFFCPLGSGSAVSLDQFASGKPAVLPIR